MKRLLLMSMKARAFMSACISAFVVCIVATVVVISAKPEWENSLIAYEKYYFGGDQVRCEALFSKFNSQRREPTCEDKVTSRSESKNAEEFFAEVDRSIKQRKDCLDEWEFIRKKDIASLWESACPINEYQYGLNYLEQKVPTLRAPTSPGTLIDFAWTNSAVNPGKLALLFASITLFLLISISVVGSIYKEPHVGWQRLVIVLSILLAPIPLVIFAQDNDPNLLGAGIFLLLGLLGAAASLIIVRKTVVWIRAGFISQISVRALDQPSMALATFSEVVKVAESKNISASSTTFLQKPNVETPDDAAISFDESRDALLALPLASSWRRFFARMIDLWMLSLPVSFVAAIFIDQSFLEHKYLLGIAILPFTMLVEAAVSAVCGNSPGKALLAIRLTTIGGGRLSFRDLCERGRSVYVYGMAFGIPFISLFPMIKQYQNLNAGRPASYDLGRYSVRVSDLGAGRKFIAGIVLIALLGIPGFLSAIYK
jgi:hypothetical protein